MRTLALVVLGLASSARAQPSVTVAVGRSQADALAVRADVGAEVRPGLRLSLSAEGGSVRARYVSGFAFSDGSTAALRGLATVRLGETSGLQADLVLGAGVRTERPGDEALGSATPGNEGLGNGTAFVGHVGVLVHLPLDARTRLLSGFTIPVEFELAPEGFFDHQGSEFHAGIARSLGSRTALVIHGAAGPGAGGDGDTVKFLWRGSAGLRFSLGRRAPDLVVDP